MKKIILICAFLLCCKVLFAKDVALEWRKTDKADTYRVVVSEDLGLTWNEISGLAFQEFVVGDRDMVSTNITVVDDKIVLIRIGAENKNGISWRADSGVWVNSLWQPPPMPGGFGIN
jgi:hypothetical protein